MPNNAINREVKRYSSLMTTVKKNIIANYTGTGINILTSIIFVPIFIKFIGIEAYGLIGFYTSLQIIISLLDMGFSAAFAREIARLSVIPDSAQTIQNLVKTFSTIYWSAAIVLGLLFIWTASFFSHHWIKSTTIPTATIHIALILVGVSIAARWPTYVYMGALGGLQKQVAANVMSIVFTVLRTAGAALILWLISPTIVAFFLWQCILYCCNTICCIFVTHHRLPKSQEIPHFDRLLVKKIWKFAAGMAGINIFATLLYQMDKVVLPKLITLQSFGYYSLASNLAYCLIAVIFPITGALYPRFAQLASTNSETLLKQLYHQTCQLVSILVIPIGIMMCLFSYEILFLWTHNREIAKNTSDILSAITLGMLLNAFMAVPYYLQIAYGRITFLLWYNIGAVIVFTPLIIFLVRFFGPIGGAVAWIIINSFYILIVIHFMHSKLLVGEKFNWYFNDVAKPLLVAAIVGVTGRFCLPGTLSPTGMIVSLSVIYSICFIGSIMSVDSFWKSWRFQIARIIRGTGTAVS